jgi:hypothetical protein
MRSECGYQKDSFGKVKMLLAFQIPSVKTDGNFFIIGVVATEHMNLRKVSYYIEKCNLSV